MNPRIFFFAIVSASAGFLFGFDTVVISGAEQTIQKLWGLSPGIHGVAMAAALYGTVVGSLAGIGENAWRWMLGVAAFPSILYTVMCFAIPESPRWLVGRKGDREAGLKVLQLIEPEATPAQVAAHADVILAASSERVASSRFWTAGLRVPILLAFLIAFFNQLSGINAVLYFAPRIFEMAGLGAKAALLQSVGIGVTNLIFTFVGLWLIDRLGRRTLLYIGSFGYIASLGLTAWAFFSQHYAIVPACIFAFIAAHAVGQGAVIWVFISEISPTRQRAEGQALGSSTHWIFAALLTTFFPKMVTAFPPGHVFLFFCGMMILQLLWVKTMVPEKVMMDADGLPAEPQDMSPWDNTRWSKGRHLVMKPTQTGMFVELEVPAAGRAAAPDRAPRHPGSGFRHPEDHRQRPTIRCYTRSLGRPGSACRTGETRRLRSAERSISPARGRGQEVLPPGGHAHTLMTQPASSPLLLTIP